jgi:hypothetical protein
MSGQCQDFDNQPPTPLEDYVPCDCCRVLGDPAHLKICAYSKCVGPHFFGLCCRLVMGNTANCKCCRNYLDEPERDFDPVLMTVRGEPAKDCTKVRDIRSRDPVDGMGGDKPFRGHPPTYRPPQNDDALSAMRAQNDSARSAT